MSDTLAQPAAIAASQMVLPGLEPFVSPRQRWRPIGWKLEKLYTYLLGFKRHLHEIFAKRKTIAAKLGWSVATVSRYIAHLVAEGRLQTTRRAQCTAYRAVVENMCNATPGATPEPPGPISELKSEEKPGGTTSEIARTEPRAVYDPAFKAYIGVFASAGKPMNHRDLRKAYDLWCALAPEDKAAAHPDAIKTCQSRRFACFIPLPANHLKSYSWTRTAMPRTLEYIDPKTVENESEMLRLLQEVAR